MSEDTTACCHDLYRSLARQFAWNRRTSPHAELHYNFATEVTETTETFKIAR